MLLRNRAVHLYLQPEVWINSLRTGVGGGDNNQGINSNLLVFVVVLKAHKMTVSLKTISIVLRSTSAKVGECITWLPILNRQKTPYFVWVSASSSGIYRTS